VVATTRYAVDNSAWSTFTPIAYPWVTSILLFPIVLVRGIDYEALKLVPTIAFVAAALAYLRLAEQRFGWLLSSVVALFVALNTWYLGATDAVLSDLPFMALVLGALVALDRGIERGDLLSVGSRAGPVAGALVALAFHTRREAMGLVLAIALAQLVVRRRAVVAGGAEPLDLRGLARPWLWLGAVAIAGHVLFPAPILGNVDDADGTGPSQIIPNLRWYRLPFAELLGIKDIGDQPVEALGSAALGDALVVLVLGLAAIGAVTAVVRAIRGQATFDAHVAAAVVGIGLGVMMTPYHYQRYIYVLVPLVLLLAVRAVLDAAGAVVGGVHRATAGSIAAIVLLAPMVVGVVADTRRDVRYHHEYEYLHWGPADPAVQEMFDAVVRLTDGRDVIVFFQARAMSLYTRRRAIQGNSETMMLERGDWYAMERDSDYIQTPLTDARAAELGFRKVWENGRFVLWDIPERVVPALAPP
jgi:hypothetical protein